MGEGGPPAAARPPASPGDPPARWGAGDVLLAAVGFGLVAGTIEAIAAKIRSGVMHRSLYMGPELIWQLPLADAILFLALALLLLAAGVAWAKARSPRVVLALFASLAIFFPLLLSEKIHVAAEAFLALGFGVAAARALSPRADGLRRGIRIGVPAALGVLALVGLGQAALRRSAERRGIAALPAAAPNRPNILLLVLDTVRAWNLSLYGYGRATTPELARWAAQGTLFQRALAPAPWTTLSHAVMFTGRYPTELSVGWRTPFDGAYPTLADGLRAAGYLTAGFAGNYLNVGRGTGLDRGFLHYEDYPARPIPLLRRSASMLRLLAFDRVAALIGRRRMLQEVPAARLNRRFLDWIGAHPGRPWFAFVNYFEAHGPYLPPAPFDTQYFGKPAPAVDRFWQSLFSAYGRALPVPEEELSENLDAYDGAISYLDGQVDALLRSLRDRGVLNNTIVVVTSDHGELFGEHGLIGHGNNLYLPVLHVPLLILAPGRAPQGASIPSLASLRDLPATLFDLAGVANPGLPGHSLAQLWRGQGAESFTDTLVAAVDYHSLIPRWPPSPVLRGSMRTVVLDSLQYILNGDGAEELYHLGLDSWEVRNLVGQAEYGPELERLRRALRGVTAGGR